MFNQNQVLLHLVAAVGYLGTVVKETHTAVQRTYTSLSPTTGWIGPLPHQARLYSIFYHSTTSSDEATLEEPSTTLSAEELNSMHNIMISIVACLHSGNYNYHFAAEIETQVLKSNTAATDADIILILLVYYYSKYVYIYVVTK